jgi:hypothetical protein
MIILTFFLSGLILGYFYLIGDIVSFMMCTLAAISATLTSCVTIEEMYRNFSKENPHTFGTANQTEIDHDQFQSACGTIKTGKCYLSDLWKADKSVFHFSVMVVIMVIGALVSIGFGFMAWCLIKGTKTVSRINSLLTVM